MTDTNIPGDLKYTKSHEWIKLEKDIAWVGITDHAQQALGDLVYVELPEVGSKVEQGKEFVVVESVKAAADVYAPVSGTVMEVNTTLDKKPELLSESPYKDGWIVKLKITEEDNKNVTLLSADEYKKQLAEN